MISEKDCIRGLQEAADLLDKSPTKAEYEATDITPSSSTILRLFESWNEAKKAAGLTTYTQSEGGGVPIEPKPDDVSIPENREWEELSAQQRWYYKNREHRIEVKNKRKQELRRWFYEYKRDNFECQNCGEEFPGCLDFHHIGSKTNELSKLVAYGYGKDRIKTEIDRCVVLCANCHHKEHIDSRLTPSDLNNPYPIAEVAFKEASNTDLNKRERRASLRDWVNMCKVRMGGCARCPESDPRCLDFHHSQSATEKVPFSTLIAYESSQARFREEFEKCEILCRNCHRKEHYDIPIRPG